MTGDDPRRRIPRTDAVLADPRLAEARARLGYGTVKDAVHSAQSRSRRGEIPPDAVADAAHAALPAAASTMRAVLNATGVVLHTNLGRAPLSPAAVQAVVTAAGYVDVEYDTGTGARARRGRGALDALRAAVPAAQDVHVVNNGAAALVLAATALAAGREIVISRAELVEIGDGFRLPDLLESTGARLREVGTTNRTHLSDYAAAVGPQTGFVLKVHPSNFRIVGFTSQVPVRELATLAVPVVGFQCDRFPAFYARDSGLPVPRVDDVETLAALVHAQAALDWPTSIVIANPPPAELALAPPLLEKWIAAATAEATNQGISGKDTTPFLLAELARLSEGRTVILNEALVLDNARLAATLAAALGGVFA